MSESLILEIDWDEGVSLPRFVGPFHTLVEAEEWAKLNVPNGVWNPAYVASPYAQATQ